MSSTEKKLLNELRTGLNQAEIKIGESLCVAYSGGPDSTALLSLLVTLKSEYGYRLHAVYVEHGIRGREERQREIRLVLETADRLNVPLFIQCLPPGFLQREARIYGGLEGAARRWRYAFLEGVRDLTGGRFVALAHTADDRAETLLIRIFQGSGPEGLTGMRPVEAGLFRPMLQIKKAAVLEYLDETGLDFSIDSTNESPDYLRNALRNELVPTAARLFPSFQGSLELLSEKMSTALEALEAASPPDPVFLGSGDRAKYDHELFFRLPLYYRISMIYRLYNKWYPDRRDRLPYTFLRELCGGASEAGQHLYGAGHGLKMEKRGSELFWKRDVVPFRKKSYLRVVKSGIYEVGNSLRYRVFSEDHAKRGADSGPDTGIVIMTGADYLPCVVRSSRRGDIILLPSGPRRISALQKALDVPGGEETETAIIEDRRGILALVLSAGDLTVLTGVHAVEPVPGGTKYRLDFGVDGFAGNGSRRDHPELSEYKRE